MGNAAILINLMLGFLDHAQVIGDLLAKVHSEGRDVTEAELDALFADDDKAKAALQAAINAKKAAGG